MRTNRRKLMASRELPITYERLKYISNPNKGYIDTGFVPNQDTRIVCTIKTPKIGDFFCFGSSNSWTSDAFEFWPKESGTRSQLSYDGQGVYGDLVPFDTLCEIDFNKNVWKYNGVIHTFSYKEFTCPWNLFIWHSKRYGEIFGNVDYYDSFKIYDNGKLIRDFIPAKRKSDGVIGMYDLVGRKFYTSPNGAAFTGG